MNNEIVVTQSRIPMPAGLSDIDQGKWRVLVESVFPNAKTAEAVTMALDYCRARKLDPFKRPVNIVPMWNKTLGKEVETVWPSINEVQITAARTGQYAGMDEPKWGADVEKKFSGERNYKEGTTWKKDQLNATVVYPEYCAVTVYRMINGVRCPFTEPVYWLEAYARMGKTDVPNDMWQKRPRGQLLKVAKAFSLRAAFPEEGEHVAEEMEGKEISHGGVVIDNEPPANILSKSVWQNAARRNEYCAHQIKIFKEAADIEELETLYKGTEAKRTEMLASGNDHDEQATNSITQHYELLKSRFEKAPPVTRAGSNADINALRGFPADDIPEGRWTDEPASYAANDMPETGGGAFLARARAQRG
jgi:phage recombination protein Bet